MQVEHFLTARDDVQDLAQLGADDAGEIAIQLAEGRVVCGVYQPAVKHQVAGDVGVEIAVIVAAADTQGLAQCHQVFIGSAHCRQANGLDFEDVPGFPGLLKRTTGQRLQSIERIDHRPQVTAVALTDFDQPGKRQHAHGFAHGVATDAQLGGQLRLGGQALAHDPGALVDALAQLIQGLIDQGSFH
ncbi:hypothetical protein D3C78_1365750 [compost metagenome]